MRLILGVFALLGSFSFANASTLSVSPSSVNFFNVDVGGFGRSQTLYVRNQTDKDINVSVSDSCFGDFRVSNSCFYLNRYGTCTIRVEFRPRRQGYQSCSITIRDQTTYSSEYISISGRGVER